MGPEGYIIWVALFKKKQTKYHAFSEFIALGPLLRHWEWPSKLKLFLLPINPPRFPLLVYSLRVSLQRFYMCSRKIQPGRWVSLSNCSWFRDNILIVKCNTKVGLGLTKGYKLRLYCHLLSTQRIISVGTLIIGAVIWVTKDVFIHTELFSQESLKHQILKPLFWIKAVVVRLHKFTAHEEGRKCNSHTHKNNNNSGSMCSISLL